MSDTHKRMFARLAAAGFHALTLAGCIVAPGPRRVWIAGHWEGPVWVRGHYG